MNANFTPEQEGYKELKPFKYWVQSVLPQVYDDSLSYQELLQKVVYFLNVMLENETALENNMTALLDAYNELQNYVNDYFNNLDVEGEIDRKLDRMAESGRLSQIISPFIPALVTNWLNDNVDPVGSAVIVDKSLSIDGAAADSLITGKAIKNVNDSLLNFAENGYVNINGVYERGSIGTDGQKTDSTNNYRFTEDMPCDETIFYDIKAGYKARFFFYNSSGFIKYKGFLTGAGTLTVENASFVNVRVQTDPIATVDPATIYGNVNLYNKTKIIDIEHELNENVLINKGLLDENIDLNNIKETGFYALKYSPTYINFPFPAETRRFLVVHKVNEYRSEQIAYNMLDGNIAVRELHDSIYWTDWVLVYEESYKSLKKILGANEHRKALDHGGFFDRVNNVPKYEDSPQAFLAAAKEGIKYHNIDVCFTSDGVPVVYHDNNTTDVNGNSFKISETTLANLKAKRVGDSDYSWTIQTLAECALYLANLGGMIDMLDVSVTNPTRCAELPQYYAKYNINPTWTNFNVLSDCRQFIQNNSNNYGIYFVCSNEQSITDALNFIDEYTNATWEWMLNIYATSIGESAVDPYVQTIRNKGVHIYTYIYNPTGNVSVDRIPVWSEGCLSEKCNCNYELYKNNI